VITELLIGFSNDVAIGDDGWAMIAPFGDFPGMALVNDGRGGVKKQRAIQRIDKEAVTQMVNEFQGARRGVRKFLTGRKLFVGHPDVPGMKARYPDAEAKGVFANLAARADGLYGEPVLTEEGEQIIAEKQYRALSGRWEAEEVGEENGTKIYRPTKFISAGLTNQPNLPVQLLNEAETDQGQEGQEKNTHMKKSVIALLMGLGVSGITIANEATDEQVSDAVKALGEKAKTADTLAGEKATLQSEKTTLANDKATLAGDKARLEGEVATLKTEKATATTERDTAKTAFANERKARIGELLDGGIATGRIIAADRATWESRLSNEATFANEAEALKKLGAQMKTKSVTLQRGDRKVELSNAVERKEMVTEIVNERMQTTKCSYDAAYTWAQKEHPALFSAMEKPEIRNGGPKKA
jgi:hypothetical protein